MVLIVEEDRDLANNLQKSFAKRGFIAYAVNSFSATCDIVKKIFLLYLPFLDNKIVKLC